MVFSGVGLAKTLLPIKQISPIVKVAIPIIKLEITQPKKVVFHALTPPY